LISDTITLDQSVSQAAHGEYHFRSENPLSRLKYIFRSNWPEISSFLLPFLIYILALNYGGGQSGNIVGMQSSMVQTHAFNLVQGGMDVVSYNGYMYNAYAPGFAFLSLPFALVGFLNYGSFLGYTGNAAVADELFLAMCAALTGVVVYRLCRFYSKTHASLAASLALTLATSVLPFAVSVFPHDTSLLFSCLAVYLVMLNVKSKSQNDTILLFAGISLGIATLTEYASGLFAIPLLVYLVINKRKITPSIRIKPFLSGAIFATSFTFVGIGLNFLYNYTIFGNPSLFPQAVYSAGVHFFLGSSTVEHLFFYLVSPFRGVFFLSPVLVLGILGIYLMYSSPLLRTDSLLFISLFTLDLIYYSAWQGWDGAWAYGPRFLIIGLPYIAVPISGVLSEKPYSKSFVLLFMWSSLIQLAGAVAGPSSPGRNAPLLFQLTSYAIPQIVQGASSVLLLEETVPGNSLAAVGFFLIILIAMWYAIAKIACKLQAKRGSLGKQIIMSDDRC
jgi:hypothetical protein